MKKLTNKQRKEIYLKGADRFKNHYGEYTNGICFYLNLYRQAYENKNVIKYWPELALFGDMENDLSLIIKRDDDGYRHREIIMYLCAEMCN